MKAMFLFIAATLGMACAAADTAKPNAATPAPLPKMIVNIPALARLDAAAVAKVMGKPSQVTKITNTPENMPGEYRTYAVAGTEDSSLTVRFYKGAAIGFVLSLDQRNAQPRAEDLAAAAGFVHAARVEQGPSWAKFVGTFDGVTFRDIRVTTSGGEFDHLASTVSEH